MRILHFEESRPINSSSAIVCNERMLLSFCNCFFFIIKFFSSCLDEIMSINLVDTPENKYDYHSLILLSVIDEKTTVILQRYL